MKLPNADKLIVERGKLADYLLNPTHRYGASKARFFFKFGFSVEKWEELAGALRVHGRTQGSEARGKPALARVTRWRADWSRRMAVHRVCAQSGNGIAVLRKLALGIKSGKCQAVTGNDRLEATNNSP